MMTHIKSESLIHSGDNEINLLVLYMILLRRKKIVIVTMVVVLLMAITYLLLVTPIYEGKTAIQVGQVGQIGAIENLEILKSRLKIEYPDIKRISSAGDFVTITIYAHTKEDVKQRLKKITDQLLREHNDIYNIKIAGQQKKFKFLRNQIDGIHNQITELSYLINTLIKIEPSQATILVLEKNKLTQNLIGLEEKADNFNQRLGLSTQSKLVQEPSVTDKPIKPKARLLIILSIILGLMAGIFCAFIVEFIIKIKQKMMITET